MTRSLALATYLAVGERGTKFAATPAYPPRPTGRVIWAWCSDTSQDASLQTLRSRFADDGEDLTIVSTQSDGSGDYAAPTHTDDIANFIAHWQPTAVLWCAPSLDPTTVNALENHSIPLILTDASNAGLEQTSGRRFPGLLRGLLAHCHTIYALADDDRRQIIQSGASRANTITTGPLEQSIPGDSVPDDQRQGMAATIGTRPLWLAADLAIDELPMVIAAHRHVARRAHRLLTVIAPADNQLDNIVHSLTDAGLSFVMSSDGPPRDSTQVLIADTADSFALFVQLASMSYLGGSLSDGAEMPPFVIAKTGSALISGPHRTGHDRQWSQLLANDAVCLVEDAKSLAAMIEALLATDQAAQYAHRAWDVISSGTEVTDQLVELIYSISDAAGG